MGKLLRRTLDDYETVAEWSKDDSSSVEAAQQALRAEIDAGHVAVRTDQGRNEPVTELPADADEVVLTMPMGGG
jgi:hypothetical protein